MCAMGLVLVSSCSFVFVTGPERAGRGCTTSRIPPALDALGAGALAFMSVATIGAAAGGDSGPSAERVAEIFLGFAAGAITTGVSAVYGFRATSRCSDAIVDWNAFADHAAQERAASERAKLLAHLDELHRQARIAARADHCPNAKDIAARIRELDTTYYEAEVAHDGELARCLISP